MVVLTNRFSASASEIVAGALQDYGRAIIVGSDHTHGKGTVQVIMDLDKSLTLRNMRQYMPLGALKMTTQKFYRVTGDSTQYRGIVPDIILPDRSRYNEYGERYLDNSLKWDRIDKVEHKEWPPINRVSLDENSQGRVAEDEDFIEIVRISEAMRERIKDTHQSLLLADVIKERDELQGMEISPHGDKNEPVDDDDKEDSDTDDDDKDPTEKLIESVLEDAYAKEAMAILLDLAEQQKEANNKGAE
jgi:carboxyl-terminal processing protease